MGKLIVEQREYNPHKNFIEIRFRIERYEETGFTFKAQEKGKPGVQLPVKVLYEENGNYVIEVQELSPNWGALALDIYNKTVKKNKWIFGSLHKMLTNTKKKIQIQRVQINLFRRFLPIKEKQKRMMNC